MPRAMAGMITSTRIPRPPIRYQLVSGSRDVTAFGTGAMTEIRWRNFYLTMQSEGLYPKGLDYTKAYDLRFMRGTLQNFK